MIGGHICVDLFDVASSSVEPRDMPVWKQLSRPTVWKAPDPELILPSDLTDQEVFLSNSIKPQESHAPSSSSMASGMAQSGGVPSSLHQERLHLHDRGSATTNHAEAMVATSSSSVDKPSEPPGSLPTPRHQEVWQQPREVCKVQSVPENMEVGRAQPGLDSVSFPRHWITKLLLTIVTIATAVIGPDTNGHPNGLLASETKAQAEGSFLKTDFKLDELSGRVQPPHGASHRSGELGSVSDSGARFTNPDHGGEPTNLRPGGIHRRPGLCTRSPRDGEQGQSSSLQSARGVGSHHMGCLVEHCPAEAHYVIGMIERRNAVLRLTIERLIDQFAISSLPDVPSILIAACHATNQMAYTRGRSAYQAVFGRIPRLPDDVLTDDQVLSTSTQPYREDGNPALKAELVRSEALKCLVDLNAQQQFRRALLRRTKGSHVPELQPGQRCAVWRWTKKGVQKRGAWLMARFLSWDPGHVNKQAWVRLGASTTLVTAEQLRAAHGYEEWCPDEKDVKALKDASLKFEQHMLEDDRGPPPEADAAEAEVQLDDLEYDPAPPMTPAMLAPAPITPAPSTPAPVTPRLPAMQQSQTQVQTQVQTSNIHVNIDSPTYNQAVQHIHQRFGDLPKHVTSTKSRRSHPYSGSAPPERTLRFEPTPELSAPAHASPLATIAASSNSPPIPPEATTDKQQYQAEAPTIEPQPIPDEPASAAEQASNQPQESVEAEQTPQVVEEHTTQPTEAPTDTAPADMESSTLPTLPQKRTFDSLVCESDGRITRASPHWAGTPPIGYGPHSKFFFQAYANTQVRQEDVEGLDKPGDETDTSVDSEDSEPPRDKSSHPRGLTRQEQKQLDREIPWRQILTMPPAYVDKFIGSVVKEADSWSEWQSVRPLSEQEEKEVLSNPALKPRILKSRAAYRDKNAGQGELKAKCRIVCLGHLDPDLKNLSRSSPTPGRCAEMLLYAMLVAGYNAELFRSAHTWTAWAGDAATAFLQGRQKDSERPLPLFMWAPRDGIIAQTNCWTHRLYQILGNVYGLSNAPHLWTEEIVTRLSSKSYSRHDFDKMMFVKRDGSGAPISVILIYVDDFIGIYRSDYDISEVHSLFKWGSLQTFEEETPVVFKGKELTLKKSQGRYTLKITMEKFINGLDHGRLPRGRAQQSPTLSADEQKEFRSASGCLQWAATQCRPEIAPTISLANHGQNTSIKDLKDLYEALAYLKETPKQGLLMQDVPFTEDMMLLAYSDASWANAANSGSQIGIVVGITSKDVKRFPQKFSVIDWRSSRATRVCRSTLAAEASAGDEASDRLAFLNMMVSELMYNEPSHKVGCRMEFAQATDAKSLFDAVISVALNLTDKRSLVNVRAIQENVDAERIHWIPTWCQFADGLTKVDERLRSIFRAWLEAPFAILVDHPENAELLAFLESNTKRKNTSEKVEQAVANH